MLRNPHGTLPTASQLLLVALAFAKVDIYAQLMQLEYGHNMSQQHSLLVHQGRYRTDKFISFLRISEDRGAHTERADFWVYSRSPSLKKNPLFPYFFIFPFFTWILLDFFRLFSGMFRIFVGMFWNVLESFGIGSRVLDCFACFRLF